MANPPVKFGIVGYGAWGTFHGRAIDLADGAEVAAVCDTSEAALAAAREAFPDAALFSQYEEMLKHPELDVVDLVLPNHLHYEPALAALSAGYHLLLEKPMALSVEECDEITALAEENDRILAIVHEFRLSALWGKVKQLVDAGEVGDPQYVLVELARNPYRRGADGWRFDIDRVGSWILEEPIHFFDLARWYLEAAGEPRVVYAAANSRQPGHAELQDNVSAIMHFDGGRYAVVSQTLAAFEHHHTVKISGTRGAIWASWSGAMDRVLHATAFLKAFDGSEVRAVPIERETGEVHEMVDQIAMMVEAVRTGRLSPMASTGNDGKWAVAMCLAATQSAETGEPVTLQGSAR